MFVGAMVGGAKREMLVNQRIRGGPKESSKRMYKSELPVYDHAQQSLHSMPLP